MSLSQEERRIMVQVEIERAERMVKEFPIYQENNLWSTLVNRMYYAAFHAATALLIKNGLHAGTHQGVYILLSRHFIKDGILSVEEGRLFARLETLREKGDYNCFIDPESEDVLPLLEPTKAFIGHIRQIINHQS
jgi:uncharacterized protein (UPF0332 family)